MVKLFKQLKGGGTRLLLALAVIAVTVAVGVPAQVSADPWRNTDNFGQLVSINTAPSETMCLRATASPSASSWQDLCSNNSDAIRWHMRRQSNGYYKIQSYISAETRCLTVDNSSNDLPLKVATKDCKPNDGTQEWYIGWTSYGFTLHPSLIYNYNYDFWGWYRTGPTSGWSKCLDVYGFSHSQGGLVALWDCNRLPNQTWRFTGLFQ